MKDERDQGRLAGVLLGTALGDALGLPMEGLGPKAIVRRFGRPDRFHLLGRTGFVSDDTEQAAVVAEGLCRHPRDPEACSACFRRELLSWFLRLPWGVGRATVRSCGRIAFGQRPSGVDSAGNGAAMRAGVIGVFFRDDPGARHEFGRALAEVTHTDARAVEGALYVAEVAALLTERAGITPEEAVFRAKGVVAHAALAEAIERAFFLARDAAAPADAATELGTSGYTVHTVGWATFCLLRFGADPLAALQEAIVAGGDTDSAGAVLGGWLGVRHGVDGLPAALVRGIHDGPYGPSHLRRLASALAYAQRGAPVAPPSYSKAAALGRNLALYPVILAHGFRRLLP